MLVEFIIDADNDRWRWRMIRYLLLPFGAAATLIVISFFAETIGALIWAAIILLAGTIWAYNRTRKVLYRLSFDNETKQVTVDIVLFDELHKRFVIPFESFGTRIFSIMGRRESIYVLEIFDNKKLLYRQKNVCGWTHDDFKAIQDYAGLMIPTMKK